MFANREIAGVKVPCVALYIVVIIFIFAYGYYRRKRAPVTSSRKSLPAAPAARPRRVGDNAHSVLRASWVRVSRPLRAGPDRGGRVGSIRAHARDAQDQVSGVRLQLMGATDNEGRPIECDDDSDKGNAWWYGRESDVCYDMIGYILGSALGERLWPQRPKKRPASY